jgi:hypothetical protein
VAVLVSGALSTACGGSDAEGVEAPSRPPIAVAEVAQVPVRSGHDVFGYCAASKGALMAIAVIERSSVTLYTSTSATLEEASFVAGPSLPELAGASVCSLVAMDEGFALGWVRSTTDGPLAIVQRLSDDGTPLTEPVPVAATSRDRFALVTGGGGLLYTARTLDSEQGGEIWIDTINGDQITSEPVATCASPSLPTLLPGVAGMDALYVCSDAETAELTLSQVVDGERQTAAIAALPAALGEPTLGAIDRGDHWAVIWSTSAVAAFPPLLAIDKQSLEVTEHAIAERTGVAPWDVRLLEQDAQLVLQATLCGLGTDTETDTAPCQVELCTLDLESKASNCSVLAANSSQLLLRERGAVLAFMELQQDSGGDLFTVAVDDEMAIAAVPAPVLGPGRLDPLRVDCVAGACTVFGREGASRIETVQGKDRSGTHRYGFWTLDNSADPSGVAREAVVLEASQQLVHSEIWGFDWSVGALWRTDEARRFGVLDAGGVRLRDQDLGDREPVALFHEDLGGVSRYRLFDFDAALDTPGLYLTTLDELETAPAARVGADRLELIGRCGSRYVGIDAQRRLMAFDPDLDPEFAAYSALPELAGGDGEIVRCLGERVVGVSYTSTELQLYREEPDGSFREWQFSDSASALPLAADAFRAAATRLDDGRMAFVLQPGAGFGVPLAAALIGETGEPEFVELPLPEGTTLAAAVTTARQLPRTIVLAWSEAATRDTNLSTFRLP